jgi:hypothetical protein
MTNEQIIEMAKQSGTPIRYYYDENGLTEKELIACARLIEKAVKKEDAQICLSLFDANDDSCNEAEMCAAAIRKGE